MSLLPLEADLMLDVSFRATSLVLPISLTRSRCIAAAYLRRSRRCAAARVRARASQAFLSFPPSARSISPSSSAAAAPCALLIQQDGDVCRIHRPAVRDLRRQPAL